ncbi:MAG: hypothetical protein AAGG50_07545 [Bacteroidota bacterium]
MCAPLFVHPAPPFVLPDRLAAVTAAARAWQDPDFPTRAEAVVSTLGAPNRFTEEAMAYAINHQMHQLGSPKKLAAWIEPVQSTAPALPVSVGIAAEGAVPLDALRAMMGVWLAGHAPVVRLSATSPHLLRAFAETIAAEAGSASAEPITFAVDDAHLLTPSTALIASGDADTCASWTERGAETGLDSERVLLHPRGTTVAVIDGTEDFEERVALAEDVLLHEGLSPANVALLWAPVGLDPDPYFEAFSGFRQVMPAHPDTDGVLEMPRAFLKAADLPYAWGDGVLVSRGAPDVQQPGHLRWSEYETPDAVQSWIAAHRAGLHGVVAASRVTERLRIAPDLHIAPGEAHRERLCSAADRALIDFLARLGG